MNATTITTQRPPTLVNFIIIGLLQAGVALYFAIKLIINTSAFTGSIPVSMYVTPALVVVAVVGILLTAVHKRVGLMVGSATWLISLVLTVVGLIQNMSQVIPDLRTLDYIVVAGTIILDLFMLYRFYRYATHEPEKSYFN